MILNPEKIKPIADTIMEFITQADGTTGDVTAALAMAVVYVEKSTATPIALFDRLLKDTRQKSNPSKN